MSTQARHATPPPTTAALPLILTALLSGCSQVPPPTFALRDAAVTGRTAEGLAVRFEIEAVNDSDEPLPLRTAEYALEIDGRRVFAGFRSPEATLRRRGAQTFTLPAVIPAQPGLDPPLGILTFRLAGAVRYQTPGALADLLFETGVRVPSTPLVLVGELDTNRLAPPAPPLPRIR